jgi:hypothetical protein
MSEPLAKATNPLPVALTLKLIVAMTTGWPVLSVVDEAQAKFTVVAVWLFWAQRVKGPLIEVELKVRFPE